MLMQNFGSTDKEHYGMLWYFLEWSIWGILSPRRDWAPFLVSGSFYRRRGLPFWLVDHVDLWICTCCDGNQKSIYQLESVFGLPITKGRGRQKKLQMTRNDLSNIIPYPGKLHIVLAQLKTIGAYIEKSGIDIAWVGFGLSTVKQILIYSLLTAKCIDLSLLINRLQYVFQGSNPVLPLSIQSGVRLIEVFNNRN